jgi:IS30 family transposase
MPKGYKQLTSDQRCQIYTLRKRNLSQATIATEIGVSPSTISRELLRNKGKRRYSFLQAHKKATTRRSASNSIAYRMTSDALAFIIEQLKMTQASPVQISGRMKEEGIKTVSHESIYRMITKDKKQGGSLHKHLRHRGKKYNKRLGKVAGRGCIPGRIDIEERPAIVERKERLGDLELDTIIGAKQQGAIVSIVDRASKLTHLKLLKNREASRVTQAIVDKVAVYKGQVKTFTADNGKEFASHAIITALTGAVVYFAKPYHSWQRGLNEHTNGLVRQYFPKGTNFHNLTEQDVQNVENILNNRPRKILNFKTPNEVFHNLMQNKNIALHC